MKRAWPLLILLAIFSLTAHSQSAKCYQTVQVKCGDTIVDYLTAKEKKNLFKLQVKLEQLHAEVEYLRAAGKTDSAYIEKLQGYLRAMDSNIDLLEASNTNYKQAYGLLQENTRRLNRQIKLLKARAWLGGVFGAVGAFGAGVGVTFLLLKL